MKKETILIFLLLLFISTCIETTEYELVIRLKDLSYRNQLYNLISHKKGIKLIPYLTDDLLLENLQYPSAKILSRYFQVDTEEHELEQLREYFFKQPFIDAAFIKPAPEDPVIKTTVFKQELTPIEKKLLNQQTPLFESRQIYLTKAPAGINVDAVKHIKGSDGKGIVVYDVEQGWDFKHEDLQLNPGKVVVGPVLNQYDHGCAVHGEICGNKNSFGIVGIAPQSTMHGKTYFSFNLYIIGASWRDPDSKHPRVGPTLTKTAALMQKGEIMLLEMHAIGPRNKYINMEWW